VAWDCPHLRYSWGLPRLGELTFADSVPLSFDRRSTVWLDTSVRAVWSAGMAAFGHAAGSAPVIAKRAELSGSAEMPASPPACACSDYRPTAPRPRCAIRALSFCARSPNHPATSSSGSRTSPPPTQPPSGTSANPPETATDGGGRQRVATEAASGLMAASATVGAKAAICVETHGSGGAGAEGRGPRTAASGEQESGRGRRWLPATPRSLADRSKHLMRASGEMRDATDPREEPCIRARAGTRRRPFRTSCCPKSAAADRRRSASSRCDRHQRARRVRVRSAYTVGTIPDDVRRQTLHAFSTLRPCLAGGRARPCGFRSHATSRADAPRTGLVYRGATPRGPVPPQPRTFG
jgi:hypothetical protein